MDILSQPWGQGWFKGKGNVATCLKVGCRNLEVGDAAS